MRVLPRLQSRKVVAQRYFLVAVNYTNRDILLERISTFLHARIMRTIPAHDPQITICSVTPLSTERVKSMTYRKPPKK